MHACPADLPTGLVYVARIRVSTPQNEQAIVAEVIEVAQQCVESLLFAIFEESVVLLAKLIDDMVEEVERVDLVLLVRIDRAHNVDDIPYNCRLSQDLEESLILAEFVEDGASVDCSMDIILVLG